MSSCANYKKPCSIIYPTIYQDCALFSWSWEKWKMPPNSASKTCLSIEKCLIYLYNYYICDEVILPLIIACTGHSTKKWLTEDQSICSWLRFHLKFLNANYCRSLLLNKTPIFWAINAFDSYRIAIIISPGKAKLSYAMSTQHQLMKSIVRATHCTGNENCYQCVGIAFTNDTSPIPNFEVQNK